MVLSLSNQGFNQKSTLYLFWSESFLFPLGFISSFDYLVGSKEYSYHSGVKLKSYAFEVLLKKSKLSKSDD